MVNKFKAKIDDRGGSGAQYKLKNDGDLIKVEAYNDHFYESVDIPTEIFMELARKALNNQLR